MKKFLIQRLLLAIPTLMGVTIVVFLLTHLSGDPTSLMLPDRATEEQREAFRRAYGLDQPLHIQYLQFLARVAQGDLGRSIASGEQVLDLLMQRWPATIELATVAMLLSIVVGLGSGVLASVVRGTVFDRLLMILVVLGQSVATFWLGIMLVLVFAVQFRMFPVSGRGEIQHLVLPSITLAAYLAAVLGRLTRSSMLEVLGQDFIRTAHGKGLSAATVVLRHGLRAGLIPIVTVIGLQFGVLMAGTVVTETVFSWPGVGSLVVDAIFLRDYPVVQGTVLMIASMFILLNLFVDALYAYIDPRIRYD